MEIRENSTPLSFLFFRDNEYQLLENVTINEFSISKIDFPLGIRHIMSNLNLDNLQNQSHCDFTIRGECQEVGYVSGVELKKKIKAYSDL